jgi:hypothetical protein
MFGIKLHHTAATNAASKVDMDMDVRGALKDAEAGLKKTGQELHDLKGWGTATAAKRAALVEDLQLIRGEIMFCPTATPADEKLQKAALHEAETLLHKNGAIPREW